MKLAIYTCAHGRFDVLAIYIEWIKWMREHYDILPVIVVDEPEAAKMCVDAGIIDFKAKNEPLGAKFNTISLMKALDFDYLMVMGSDDICNRALMDFYFETMNAGEMEFWGMSDIYFYSAKLRKLKYWGGFNNHPREGETLGAGRVLSRELLEKVNWQPWDSTVNYNLDKAMTQKAKAIGVPQHAFTMGDNNRFLMDIKTPESKSKFDRYRGPTIPRAVIKKHFPKQISDKIFAL